MNTSTGTVSIPLSVRLGDTAFSDCAPIIKDLLDLQDVPVVSVSCFVLKPFGHRRREARIARVVFDTLNPPTHVSIGGERLSVRVSPPTPSQCKRCWKFHHSQVGCQSTPRCPLCASTDHSREVCDSTIRKCPNCGSPHSAAYRGCSVYKFEREVAAIRRKEGSSLQSARKRAREEGFSPGPTYADRVASHAIHTQVAPSLSPPTSASPELHSVPVPTSEPPLASTKVNVPPSSSVRSSSHNDTLETQQAAPRHTTADTTTVHATPTLPSPGFPLRPGIETTNPYGVLSESQDDQMDYASGQPKRKSRSSPKSSPIRNTNNSAGRSPKSSSPKSKRIYLPSSSKSKSPSKSSSAVPNKVPPPDRTRAPKPASTSSNVVTTPSRPSSSPLPTPDPHTESCGCDACFRTGFSVASQSGHKDAAAFLSNFSHLSLPSTDRPADHDSGCLCVHHLKELRATTSSSQESLQSKIQSLLSKGPALDPTPACPPGARGKATPPAKDSSTIQKYRRLSDSSGSVNQHNLKRLT